MATDWKPLGSSWLAASRYNPKTQTLDVQLQSGRRYRIDEASPTQARGLQRATSAGGYFNRNLRDRVSRRIPKARS